MSRPLLALSNVIIDRVREMDGRDHPPMAGGAGLYAAAAMAMWWPSVALVAGVGANYDEVTGGIGRAYGFDPRGLVVRGDRCIESLLAYAEDGSRTERPTFGAEHFASMQIDPGDIDASLFPASGAYVFRGADSEFWAAIGSHRSAYGTILWEIDARLAERREVDALARLAPMIDILSLNLAEAAALLGDAPPTSLAGELLALGAPMVALRMGAEGALLVTDREAFHVAPPLHPVIDVTGGGNAFSGGLLAGLALHPGDLERAGRHAAASAACVLAQRGLPLPPPPELLASLADATPIHSINPV